jgi:RNA polymerase sigma-70 factor (sigma-E family)
VGEAERDSFESFDEFVRVRSTALMRTAYLLTTDRHAAEDLVQEVLERLYVRWRRIRSEPEGYARRILANRAIDRWRLRARRPEVSLTRDTEAAVADHADRVTVRESVLVALRHLPPRQRVAVVLRYLDDLPEAEVARVMGCSTGTVKSHTSRGMARLRHVLAGSFETTERTGGPR